MADKDTSSNSSGDDYPIIASATYVSSSSRIAELTRGSSLASNPFAIKATCSSSDVKDEEMKPLIAPSTLKLDDSDLSREQRSMSSSPRVILRPSRLAVQTEKLEFGGAQDKNFKAGSDQESGEKDPDSTNGENKEKKSNLFSVRIQTSVANVFSPVKDSENDSKGGGFVFGQNLHERALNYDKNDPGAVASPSKSHDLTFEEAAQKQDEAKEDEQQKGDDAVTKSLSESAKQYESKQLKRKYDEVSVITGEEEESNALQINCKLFEFNKSDKSWQERGKGLLRLNDQMCDGVMRSRLVMRTQGNLRVVLNTKVWAGMTVHHPSEKTVRISAIDSEGTRVYLIMARPKDADQLFSALDCRVSTLKSAGESSNGNEKESVLKVMSYENAAQGGPSTSDLFSYNGSASKRHRADPTDDVNSSIEFSTSGGEVSSDSVKDSTDDGNPC